MGKSFIADKKNNDIRETRWYKIVTLLSYITLYGGVGCILGILGPALPGLAEQVGLREDQQKGGAGFGKMGFAFTARGTGWLIGSVVGGVMLDRYQTYGHWLIGAMVFTAGLFTSLVAFCKNLLELLLAFLCQGFSSGSAEAMVNTLVVWLFSKKATAPLQSIHFGFGLGAFLAPIFVAESIRLEDTIRYSFWVVGIYCAIVGVLAFFVPCPTSDRSTQEKQKTAQVTSSTPQVPTYTRFEDPNTRIESRSYDSGVHLDSLSKPSKSDEYGFVYRERFRRSYDAAGYDPHRDTDGGAEHQTYSVPSQEEEEEKTRLLQKEDPEYGSISSSSSSFSESQRGSGDYQTANNGEHKQQRKSISWAKATFKGRNLSLKDVRAYLRRMKIRVTLGSVLVVLTAIYLLLAVGDEVALGGWFSSYAIALSLLSEQTAALLSSMFWGALTLGRLLAIPLSTALSPPYMLLIAMLGSSIATALFAVFPKSLISLWSVTAATGLFLAPVYPSSVAMPGTFGIHITGRATSFLIVGACMGEVTVPFTIAPPFEYLGPLSFRWVTLGVTLAAFSVFIMQWVVGKKIVHSYSIGSFADSLKSSYASSSASYAQGDAHVVDKPDTKSINT